ncbi:peptidoglycan editing factor PgeF [Calderihabitans maritimus]|uniref:Purine nucleoside phosphorylase n=1 Tax=Calderihabitans maritimus TaxID=1246530 RepID=A0A1Z5HSS4_9FIRM|nr:peptidoglycan editing factor PgeF [Calderihabitans maritimus]GAW92583.1 multi-copper polyphenol oxidoreductase, laccase [Calderihabitans maritimus]
MKTASFRLKIVGPVKFFHIPAWEETGLVISAFSTRVGGVSPEPYSTLNLGFHTADEPGNVLENRIRFSSSLGVSLESWVAANQVHGDRIATVGRRERGRGAKEFSSCIPDTDGLITREPGVALTTYYADCVPIYLLDLEKKAIGLSHAGWRGTVKRVAGKTVAAMEQAFGTRASSCLAAIGPSIGPCCYEVDGRVIEGFREVFPYWQDVVIPAGKGHWKLDLWETNRRMLVEAGVPEKNITVSGICTSCNRDLLFSYRAEKGLTGRMAAFLMLR